MTATSGLPTNRPTTAEGRIDTDVACIQCDYNLRAQPQDADCPECGQPIIDSLRFSLFQFADQTWLRRIYLGIVILVFGLGAQVLWSLTLFTLSSIFQYAIVMYVAHTFAVLYAIGLFFLLVLWTVRLWQRARSKLLRDLAIVAVVVGLFVAWYQLSWEPIVNHWIRAQRFFPPLIMVVGGWLIATREVGINARWDPKRYRFALRIAWLLVLVFNLSWIFRPGWPTHIFASIQASQAICHIVAVVLTLAYLIRLAARLPEAHAESLLRGLIVCFVIVAVILHAFGNIWLGRKFGAAATATSPLYKSFWVGAHVVMLLAHSFVKLAITIALIRVLRRLRPLLFPV